MQLTRGYKKWKQGSTSSMSVKKKPRPKTKAKFNPNPRKSPGTRPKSATEKVALERARVLLRQKISAHGDVRRYNPNLRKVMVVVLRQNPAFWRDIAKGILQSPGHWRAEPSDGEALWDVMALTYSQFLASHRASEFYSKFTKWIVLRKVRADADRGYFSHLVEFARRNNYPYSTYLEKAYALQLFDLYEKHLYKDGNVPTDSEMTIVATALLRWIKLLVLG